MNMERPVARRVVGLRYLQELRPMQMYIIVFPDWNPDNISISPICILFITNGSLTLCSCELFVFRFCSWCFVFDDSLLTSDDELSLFSLDPFGFQIPPDDFNDFQNFISLLSENIVETWKKQLHLFYTQIPISRKFD